MMNGVGPLSFYGWEGSEGPERKLMREWEAWTVTQVQYLGLGVFGKGHVQFSVLVVELFEFYILYA